MECIKEGSLLNGQKQIIVGDRFHDLILENLGRIYIRYGSGYKEFNSILKSITTASSNKDSIIVTDELKDISEYPNDILIFDSKSRKLGLVHNGQFLTLVEQVSITDEKYVRKTGDIMTGALTIKCSESPLIITSKKLVNNLNANYLEGKKAEDFLQKDNDETISGNWTFNGENTFNNENKFNNQVTFKDTAIFNNSNGAAIRIPSGSVITDGSLGSSAFASGMSGYGWRLNSETNTLEIDNLIVRGILQVFELVVNKISATNGSLWVTDSFKVKTVHNLEYLDCSQQIDISSLSENTYYIPYVNQSDTYESINNSWETIFENTKESNIVNIQLDSSTRPLASRNSVKTESMNFTRFNFMFQILDKGLLQSTLTNVNESYKLANYNFMALLDANGIVEKTNLFQADPKVISEYEEITITNEDTVTTKTFVPINPEFDRQIFTTVSGNEINIIDGKSKFENLTSINRINLYYNYFGERLINGGLKNIYILESESDEYPVFKPGDIVRCQKFSNNCVKQYNGIVLGLVGSYGFIVELQNSSPINTSTSFKYDENGKLINSEIIYDTSLYEKSEAVMREVYNQINEGDGIKDTTTNTESALSSVASMTKGTPAKGDAIVRIGSIFEGVRRNSMLLTSSEDNSPYQDILVNVNRPDYSVIYYTPKYKTFTTVYTDSNNQRKSGTFYIQNSLFKNIIETGDLVVKEEIDWNDSTIEESDWETYEPIYLKYREYSIIYKASDDSDEICGTLFLTNQFDEIAAEEDNYLVDLKPITRVRVGNLSGIYNETFGVNQPNGYGLYGENVYLTGNFYLNNGKSLLSVDNGLTFVQGQLSNALEQLESITGAELESQIQTYIQNNKNSVLKIGLDYSLWALGNAGISIINPDAKYKVTDNGYEVDPDTVGNGDEYISLQGDKVQIKTYQKKTIGSETKQLVAYTNVNPTTWKYSENSSIYTPLDSEGNEVAFAIGYADLSQNFTKSTISNLNWYGKILYPENSENFEKVQFNNFYTVAEGEEGLYTVSQSTLANESTVESFISIDLGTDLYFAPLILTTALFEGDKLSANLIEAQDLVATESGKRNSNFKVKEPINDTNFPTTDTTSPYVVISGTTGKISAKDANLSGSVSVGEENDNGYVYITDNSKEDNRIDNDTTPALYILKDKENIITKFSGVVNNNPLQKLGSDYKYSAHFTNESQSTLYLSYNPEFYIESTKIDNEALESDKNLFDSVSEVNFSIAEGSSEEDETLINNGLSIPSNKTFNFIASGILKTSIYGLEAYSNLYWDCNIQTFLVIKESDTNKIILERTIDNGTCTQRTATYTETNTINISLKITNSSSESKTYNIYLKRKIIFNGDHRRTEYIEEGYAWEYSSFPDNLSFGMNTSFPSLTIKSDESFYRADYMGNGIMIGYNNENYFSSYYHSDTSSNRMILDFQSQGTGMKFDGGNFYHYIKGKSIKGYVPILQGKITFYSSNNTFLFSGTSIFGDTTVSSFAANKYSISGIKYIPYSNSSLGTATLDTTYDSTHDLYISTLPSTPLGSNGNGALIINFGDRWAEALNNGGIFLTDNSIVINCTGQCRGDGKGPLYVTVKGIKNLGSNITCAAGNFTQKNWIELYMSDDASLNYGSFYITISYCPNIE